MLLIPLSTAAAALTLSPAADAQISSLMVTHDPILHWARRLLPEKRATAASALYAWCRRLDEIVDEPGVSASTTRARLDDWEERLDKLWAGKPVDEMDGALLATVQANPSLSREPFAEMLQGMRDDANEDIRYDAFRPDLLNYCYRVAGTVGEMLLPVLGLDGSNPKVRDGAVALGCAVQLLNICRDVRTDLIGRRRIYLPLADAKACGLSASDLEELIRSAPTAPKELRRLIRLQNDRAAALLRKAEGALPFMDIGQAVVVGVLIELHWSLHDEIQRREHDTLAGGNDDRVSVPKLKKAAITAGTASTIIFRGASGYHSTLRSQRASSTRATAPSMSAAEDDAAAAAPLPGWSELEVLVPSASVPPPLTIDSVRFTGTPDFSKEKPTLFRERHGWCPYSERVWLALELKGIEYDTVRIDNTGGGRPSYFSGSTPQMRWPPSGRTQGESMDLVKALDTQYPDTPPLWPPEGIDAADVNRMVNAWKGTFPRSARPSSRAAYLFSYDGDALPLSTFEKTLEGTEALLKEIGSGPFFCGEKVSAADIAWAPFLERYAAQLPCLHEGLAPRDPDGPYPNLAKWFEAMEKLPAYRCRVEGDAASWRKVLSMAGYGNAGVPPKVLKRMDEAATIEAFGGEQSASPEVWAEYARTRPHVAQTASAEVAATILRNKDDILADVAKRKPLADEEDPDAALRALAYLLAGAEDAALMAAAKETPGVAALAAFLDGRLCCPRDMGAPAASELKRLANELKMELLRKRAAFFF